MIALRQCPDHISFDLTAAHGCPEPFRVGNHQPSIDALSELASGRVAEGREGPNTTYPQPKRRKTPKVCPDPFRVRNHKPSIDALSELVSGRVAEGREGPNTTELESIANPFPTLKGSGHPGSRQTRPSHQTLPIDALSELASGRVAEGREGPTELESTAKPFPTLKGSEHPGSQQTRPSHKPSIDALSELASGRVAEGREGPNTTHPRPKPNTPSLTGAPR